MFKIDKKTILERQISVLRKLRIKDIIIIKGFKKNKILIKRDKIYITVAEGYLNCLEIQLPNKKRMTSKALLNGYKFDPNSRVL